MKSGERVCDAPVMTSGALIHKVFPVESQTGRLPCCDVRGALRQETVFSARPPTGDQPRTTRTADAETAEGRRRRCATQTH